MNHLIRISAIVLLATLAACARHFVPDPDVPFETIPAFTSSNGVLLQNAQSSAEPYPLVLSSRGRYYANRKEWTDVAIQIAARELTHRGMSLDDKSSRTLKLSIESVVTETGTAMIETRIEMKMETGSGYSATYVGRNSSALVSMYERQVSGALMRVVAEMLKDPQVVAYLTR